MSKKFIVLSGGPCSGKSTIIKRLKEELPFLNVIQEVATDLLNADVPRDNHFQEKIIDEQIRRENEMGWGITDRGLADAYSYGHDPEDIPVDNSRYVEKYYLRSLAVINPEQYIQYCSSNPYRKETLEEAKIQDQHTLLVNNWMYKFNINILKGSIEENYKEISQKVKDTFWVEMLWGELRDVVQITERILEDDTDALVGAYKYPAEAFEELIKYMKNNKFSQEHWTELKNFINSKPKTKLLFEGKGYRDMFFTYAA